MSMKNAVKLKTGLPCVKMGKTYAENLWEQVGHSRPIKRVKRCLTLPLGEALK